MHEPVAQGSRHREMDATLRCRIPGGDDSPSIRQHVFAEFPVQHELVAAGLSHLRRGGQFIEKENAAAGGGKKLGWNPFRLVLGDPRQSPEINRVELHCPHVKKVIVEIVGDLRDDLRLPNAARAPDVQRHTFADKRMKRLIEFRWFHEVSSIGWKCAVMNFCSNAMADWSLAKFWIGRSTRNARFELQMG